MWFLSLRGVDQPTDDTSTLCCGQRKHSALDDCTSFHCIQNPCHSHQTLSESSLGLDCIACWELTILITQSNKRVIHCSLWQWMWDYANRRRQFSLNTIKPQPQPYLELDFRNRFLKQRSLLSPEVSFTKTKKLTDAIIFDKTIVQNCHYLLKILITDLKNISTQHSTAILFGQRLFCWAVNAIFGLLLCQKIIAAVNFLLVASGLYKYREMRT